MVTSSAATFELLSTLAHNFFVLSTIGSEEIRSLLHCGAICADHSGCGGIVWDPTQTPPCQFVVSDKEPGATEVDKSLKVHRLANFRGDIKLRELYYSQQSSRQASQNCEVHGLRLLPHPATLKERAILSVRSKTFAWVDLKRVTLPMGTIYTDSHGTTIEDDGSVINWGSQNPNYGPEDCMEIGDFPLAFFDYGCVFEESAADLVIFCVDH